MKPTETRPAPAHRDSIYRDGTDALRREVGALRRRHAGTVEALRAPAEDIYAARRARRSAGWVLLAGVGLVVATGLGLLLSGLHRHGPWGDTYLLTALLLATWPAAGLTYLVTRIRTRCRFARDMLAPLSETGEVHTDLDRGRRFDPARHTLGLMARLESSSMAPLLAGLALLTPLTLHFLAGGLMGADVAEFDFWIAMSGLLVGHCHLILAVRAWRYGKRIAAQGTPHVSAERYGEGWKTYGLVVASSLFPGLLLVFMPVLLVALTGLFIPLLYGWAGRRLVEERHELSMATLRTLSTSTSSAMRP